jgi:hypothetical protein
MTLGPLPGSVTQRALFLAGTLGIEVSTTSGFPGADRPGGSATRVPTKK